MKLHLFHWQQKGHSGAAGLFRKLPAANNQRLQTDYQQIKVNRDRALTCIKVFTGCWWNIWEKHFWLYLSITLRIWFLSWQTWAQIQPILNFWDSAAFYLSTIFECATEKCVRINMSLSSKCWLTHEMTKDNAAKPCCQYAILSSMRHKVSQDNKDWLAMQSGWHHWRTSSKILTDQPNLHWSKNKTHVTPAGRSSVSY